MRLLITTTTHARIRFFASAVCSSYLRQKTGNSPIHPARVQLYLQASGFDAKYLPVNSSIEEIDRRDRSKRSIFNARGSLCEEQLIACIYPSRYPQKTSAITCGRDAACFELALPPYKLFWKSSAALEKNGNCDR